MLLKNDSSLILLGTRAIINIKGFLYESPLHTDTEITNKIKKYNVFVHSSVMYRRSEFIKIGMYNEMYKIAQDYEAWIKLSALGKLSILDRVLVERTVRTNLDACTTNHSFSQFPLKHYTLTNLKK